MSRLDAPDQSYLQSLKQEKETLQLTLENVFLKKQLNELKFQNFVLSVTGKYNLTDANYIDISTGEIKVHDSAPAIPEIKVAELAQEPETTPSQEEIKE